MDINVNGIELFKFEFWRIFRMEQIFANLMDIGVATTVISLIAIFLVGCIKLIPAVKNLGEQVRKALYQGLNIVIAAALSIVYTLVIAKGGWNMDMLRFAIIVVAEVNMLYPLYENLGLRQLVRKIGGVIYNLLFKKDAKKQVETLHAEALSSTTKEASKKEDKKETFSEGEWLE